MVGIIIGIASSGRKVDLRWSLSLPTLAVNAPVGMNIAWAVKEGTDRAGNREAIAEKAVEIGFPYLFFLDDDTVCPNFTLKALHYQLANNKNAMVCGGIYCTKEDIPCPIVFEEIGGGPFYDWKVGQVFPCKGLGTGAMLIKTEVFKHLPKPWFYEPHEAPADESVDLAGSNVPVMHRGGTDDLYFCKKVSDAGFTILAHGGVLPVHLGQDGRMYTLPADSYPVRGANLQVAA